MSHATLVIIDMQDGFDAAHNPYTLFHVIKEIKTARANKLPIVQVNYYGGGKTMRQVKEAMKGYRNIDVVWKDRNDGSDYILESVMNNAFPAEKLIVCGVNTDACVCDTVIGLSFEVPHYTKIEVVEDACNSDIENDFSWVQDLSNVILRETNLS